jgi:hypothetical protein
MSTSTENVLLDDGIAKEGTSNLSNSLSNDDIESEYHEDKIYDENDIVTSSKSILSGEDNAITEAFMSMDLDEFDNFEASMNTSLGELFLVNSESYASAIYIKK